MVHFQYFGLIFQEEINQTNFCFWPNSLRTIMDSSTYSPQKIKFWSYSRGDRKFFIFSSSPISPRLLFYSFLVGFI